MTAAEMRKAISNEYPGMAWKDKVAKMSERQVYQIYWSIEHRKAAGLKKKEEPKNPNQMTIFDMGVKLYD